jgi:hypothetical protein
MQAFWLAAARASKTEINSRKGDNNKRANIRDRKRICRWEMGVEFGIDSDIQLGGLRDGNT